MKPMWSEKFSKADWIDRERVTNYPRIFVALYAIAIVIVLALSPGLVYVAGKEAKNIGADFMDVWAAGKLADAGLPADAYDYKIHYNMQKAALPWPPGKEIPFYAWHYPPMFMILAAALAFLPYGWALLLWLGATLPAYLAAMRAILPGRNTVVAALAFPGAMVTFAHGQNGFLTAGLFGGALVLLDKRPYLAGVLFGLLAYKPQFGVLIPLVLVIGGYWRTIFSAGLTVVLVACLSYFMFGYETWVAFFGSFKLTREVILEGGSTGWEKIQSVFSAVRMLGGCVSLAYLAQAIYGVTAAGALILVWLKKPGIEMRGASLVTAALMATPYVLDYDLVLLALPGAWLISLGLRNGFLPWEKITLLAVFLLPLLSRMTGQFLHVPMAPVVMAILLWMILRRAGAISRTAG